MGRFRCTECHCEYFEKRFIWEEDGESSEAETKCATSPGYPTDAAGDAAEAEVVAEQAVASLECPNRAFRLHLGCN